VDNSLSWLKSVAYLWITFAIFGPIFAFADVTPTSGQLTDTFTIVPDGYTYHYIYSPDNSYNYYLFGPMTFSPASLGFTQLGQYQIVGTNLVGPCNYTHWYSDTAADCAAHAGLQTLGPLVENPPPPPAPPSTTINLIGSTPPSVMLSAVGTTVGNVWDSTYLFFSFAAGLSVAFMLIRFALRLVKSRGGIRSYVYNNAPGRLRYLGQLPYRGYVWYRSPSWNRDHTA
jgi:hypothetical protein